MAKIDVVRYHEINRLGYLAGDALLMQIAERLTQLRDGQVARLEADIFAVALPLDAFGGTRMALSTLRAALGGRYVMPNGAPGNAFLDRFHDRKQRERCARTFAPNHRRAARVQGRSIW